MSTLKEALQAVNLFENLSDDVLDEVVQQGSTLRVPAGKPLARQGESAAGFQLILEGGADVFVNDERVSSLGVGDYFGEMSLFDDFRRTATIVSGPEGVKTFLVSPLGFGQVMDQQPEIARILLKVLAARIHRLESPSSQRVG